MLSNSIALVPETCFGSLRFLDGHYCTRVRDILETLEAISRRFSRVDLIDSMGLQTIYCHWRISVWAVKETDKLHSTSHKFILVTWQQELQSVIKQPCILALQLSLELHGMPRKRLGSCAVDYVGGISLCLWHPWQLSLYCTNAFLT